MFIIHLSYSWVHNWPGPWCAVQLGQEGSWKWGGASIHCQSLGLRMMTRWILRLCKVPQTVPWAVNGGSARVSPPCPAEFTVQRLRQGRGLGDPEGERKCLSGESSFHHGTSCSGEGKGPWLPGLHSWILPARAVLAHVGLGLKSCFLLFPFSFVLRRI